MKRSLLLSQIFFSFWAAFAGAMPLEDYNKSQSSHSEQGSHPEIYTGQVLEVMEKGGYTFFLFTPSENPGVKRWAATSPVKLKKGAEVAFSSPLVMENFYSKSLGKTFKEIVFLSEIKVVRESSH